MHTYSLEDKNENIEAAKSLIKKGCDAYIIGYLFNKENQKQYKREGRTHIYGKREDIEKIFRCALSILIDRYMKVYKGDINYTEYKLKELINNAFEVSGYDFTI